MVFKGRINSNINQMDSIPNINDEDRDRDLERLNDLSKKHIHLKKQSVKKKEVKIFIIPDECIFNKDVSIHYKM